MKEVIEKLGDYGVIPVVVIEDESKAAPLARALYDGGLGCAEVTFRTNAAEKAIKNMLSEYPDMIVGAGTILTIDQAERAVNAGARFIVSPGFDEEIVEYCLKNDIPVIPGCVTPTEVIKAIKKGLDVVKFFPAEAAGGIAMIKAMAAPFTDISFMPTGGINEKNLEAYLGYDRIVACGGSWMVTAKLIENDDYNEIARLTREAVNLVKAIRK